MSLCQNCGKQNTPDAVFCRFCGTKISAPQPIKTADPFNYSPPQPYSWKTDEFRTNNEARPTMHLPSQQATGQFNVAANPQYRPAPLAYQPAGQMTNFRCPRCMSTFPPRMERRISTAGWVTFAILLVFFFPLFWIGLLIKEDVAVCQSCETKLPV